MKLASRLLKKFGKEGAEHKPIFDKLIELLELDRDSIQSQRREAPKDVPNYSLQQAYLAGEEKRVTSIIELLTIKEK